MTVAVVVCEAQSNGSFLTQVTSPKVHQNRKHAHAHTHSHTLGRAVWACCRPPVCGLAAWAVVLRAHDCSPTAQCQLGTRQVFEKRTRHESLGEDDEWSSDVPLAPANAATAAADDADDAAAADDASGKAFPAAGASGVGLVTPSAVHEAGGPHNDEHKGMDGGDDGSGGWLAMATGHSEAPSDLAHNRRVHAESDAPSHCLAADGQSLGGGSSGGGS